MYYNAATHPTTGKANIPFQLQVVISQLQIAINQLQIVLTKFENIFKLRLFLESFLKYRSEENHHSF